MTTSREVTTDDASIVVVNLDGRYYAVQNTCTHEYALLSDGKLEGEEIICQRHGARFSVVTGAVLAPPVYENLKTYPVRVTDDWVEVDAEGEVK